MAHTTTKRSGEKRIGAAGQVCLRHPVDFGGLSWDLATINTQEASYPS